MVTSSQKSEIIHAPKIPVNFLIVLSFLLVFVKQIATEPPQWADHGLVQECNVSVYEVKPVARDLSTSTFFYLSRAKTISKQQGLQDLYVRFFSFRLCNEVSFLRTNLCRLMRTVSLLHIYVNMSVRVC